MTELKERDLSTYGFLGYPVLQAADIIMYKAHRVPVGVDQAPHVELTREIVRRFNSFYGPVFPEPEVLLTETQRLPGLDGRKMSKSYGNDISLSDSPQTIRAKVRTMMTDPARKRRHDPGNPEICPVFSYHKIYSSQETRATVDRECRTAGIGCVDCKKWMSDGLIREISPLLDRRRDYAGRRREIGEIIQDGNRRAAREAGETMQAVRQAMKLT
jgi:tryptophanyl-tRNA synthetase